MQDENMTTSANPNTNSAQSPAPQTVDPIAPSKSPIQSSGGNTSGQGSSAVVPEEVKGWSWGAFLLTWIWGIGNSVWLALLMFVPIPMLGLVMWIVLGIKGREWAWQNKRWDNIEHFNQVQRKWAIAGVVLTIISFIVPVIIVIALIAINPAAKIREAQEKQLQLQQQNQLQQQQNQPNLQFNQE